MNWKDKQYKTPQPIIENIITVIKKYSGNKKIKGYLFAKELIDRGHLTGHQLKKLKHDLSKAEGIVFELMGGEEMLVFVEKTIDKITTNIEKRKEITTTAGMSNRYRKTHTKGTGSLTESFIIYFA